jgi:hypothetical protein
MREQCWHSWPSLESLVGRPAELECQRTGGEEERQWFASSGSTDERRGGDECQ